MGTNESTPPLRVLFEALRSLEGKEEREAFLDFACRDDPALRTRLERLLGLRDDAESFFEVDGEPADDPEPADGADSETRIGPYRLMGRLGAGGCGVVYLAEQKEPVKRRVALKIIRLGMDTENVIARFEAERQSLAMMDHPNIARVLDAGATKTGRPYFVMQLVDGERITDYCDAKRLGIRERLELFIRVCHALQHAHQKGIIHRDIKPSNILIWENEGEAVPKVIDFGIAKATEAGLHQSATYTVDGQFIGTPAYMSPEQASGNSLDVDTRSDVYSLGALLYELLAGRPPFDPEEMQDTGVEEIRRTLREVEPAAPSTVIRQLDPDELARVAEARMLDPRRLVGDIEDDLDRIVRKAMAKEPGRRYSGADALAADIRCYLNDEPVSARPPGGFYRLGKLVRRNKVTFAAGAAIFVSLVVGLGAATVMSIRANHAREVAEDARAAEAALRRAAEIGQDISHAAVLVKHGSLEEADALLHDIPPERAVPSLESADTFRTLGLWHARAGRWEKAADRFAALAYSLATVDQADSEEISLNLQPAAASLCEAGDFEEYEAFRTMAAERFGETSNAVVAEQALKSCLLRPAPTDLLDRLQRLEGLMLESSTDLADAPDAEKNLAAWRRFAIGLMEYRKGAFNQALEHLDACRAIPHENPARQAVEHAVRGMCLRRQNRLTEAIEEIQSARTLIDDRFAAEPSIFEQWEPLWQDWINARILLREAEELTET